MVIMIVKDIIALIITLAVCLVWLRLNDFSAQRGWIDSRTSRKIIHIGTGPIFVICWLLFSQENYVRYLAALVPLSITIQFALVGLGIMKDEAAVQAMSRSGDPKEILKGPLYYGIVFVILTIAFWLESPIGIIALMMVCGGDGLAEILGRKYGKSKLPWNKGKSWIGSLGFLVGAWVLTIFVMAIFVSAGIFAGPLAVYLMAITIIAVISALIESVSPMSLDNISVPLAAVILGFIII